MKWIKQPYAGEEWGSLGYVELDNGNRVSVEEEDDTEVSGTSRGNKPMTVTWTTVRTLLLAPNKYTNDFVYGCADCWYAAESPRSIFPHRNAHISDEERAARRAEKDAKEAKQAARAGKKPATRPTAELPRPLKALKVVQEKPRLVASSVPDEDIATVVTNGSLNGISGISDAINALRVVIAQAEVAETAQRELAEAEHRAEVAEAELARVKARAEKLFD